MAQLEIADIFGPSDEHASPREAIRRAVERYEDHRARGRDGWLVFTADGRQDRTIEYLHGLINFGRRRVDLPRLLRANGLRDLAREIRAVRSGWLLGQRDPTLWRVRSASPATVSEILDLCFQHELEGAPDYAVGVRYELDGEPRGPLDAPLSRLSAAGWVLALGSICVLVLVAVVVSPWALPRLLGLHPRVRPFVHGGLGVAAGALSYLGGHALLARAGISTTRGS